MRRCTCLAALAFFLFTALAATAPAAGPPDSKPLSFLFLGDRGLHHPADRYAQIAPVLAGRGIEVTCTENLSDLNPATLGKYDALLNFANATRIGKDQEKALLDHVAGGGGFVPLLCASFCFLNSPEESQKHLALPAGLKARLFVAEPQIFKPITMTWDHLGRLYLAETVDYPNEMQPRGKGRDRISIVEDTDGDGDGEADRVSLFADNLSIPMSLCSANGGLIIAQAPGMLSGLEAGVQARRSAGPVSDRHTREEGRDRQHRAGQGSDQTAPIVLAATVEGFE